MSEQKGKKSNKRWGKPEKSEKPTGIELRHSLLTNGLTLIIAAAIITAGILLPTLIYPYIDSHNDSFVQLSEPTESLALNPIPNDNISLYPWSTYDESRVRQLSSEEFSKLQASGTATFLLSSLRARGMQLIQNEAYYEQKILESFRCLEPEVADGARFFVLYAGDVDEDQEADIRCSVDYDGKIISVLMLSIKWENVQLDAPILVAGDATQENNLTDGDQVASQSDVEQDNGDNDASEDGGAADSQDPNGNSADETSAEPTDNAQTNTDEDDISANTPQNTDTTGIDPDISSIAQPALADRLIWDFSYVTSREAYFVGQVDVFNAFRQLDLHYESLYGYQYMRLLPNSPTEPEVIPNDPLYNSINPPLHYPSEDYQLNIYRLPNGVELILYLNNQNQHCMGFLIRQSTPTS